MAVTAGKPTGLGIPGLDLLALRALIEGPLLGGASKAAGNAPDGVGAAQAAERAGRAAGGPAHRAAVEDWTLHASSGTARR